MTKGGAYALFILLSTTIPAFAEPSLFYRPEPIVVATASRGCGTAADHRHPVHHIGLCSKPISAWKAHAARLLVIPKQSGQSGPAATDSRFKTLREIILRNTLITESYARLYLASSDRFPACGRSLLPWVGGAALGSLKSGQVMRSALLNESNEFEEFAKYEDADYRDRFIDRFGSWIAPVALYEATVALGEGNRAIFMDLYWQLLAGATCGPDQVVKTIEADPSHKADPKLRRALKSWRLLAEAAQDCDPKKILKANHGFVEIEQYFVAQPLMYEGLANQMGGHVLAAIVEPAVPISLGSFPDFADHAGQSTPWPFINFANAKQRVSWMKDQLQVMEDEFRAKADFLEPLFCSAVDDSTEARALF